ncbi:MAG: hypothetical protein AAGJ84_11325 [Pseudomonadota bacterium]
MIRFSSIALVSAASWALLGTAQAQSAGIVASTTGDPGGVLVTRDGESYSILEGDPVFPGDIISTTSAARAAVTAFGCTVNLDANRAITLDGQFCQPTAVTSVSGGASDASTGGGGSAALLGGVGLAALVGLAAGGGGGGGDGGSTPTPVSP